MNPLPPGVTPRDVDAANDTSFEDVACWSCRIQVAYRADGLCRSWCPDLVAKHPQYMNLREYRLETYGCLFPHKPVEAVAV